MSVRSSVAENRPGTVSGDLVKIVAADPGWRVICRDTAAIPHPIDELVDVVAWGVATSGEVLPMVSSEASLMAARDWAGEVVGLLPPGAQAPVVPVSEEKQQPPAVTAIVAATAGDGILRQARAHGFLVGPARKSRSCEVDLEGLIARVHMDKCECPKLSEGTCPVSRAVEVSA